MEPMPALPNTQNAYKVRSSVLCERLKPTVNKLIGPLLLENLQLTRYHEKELPLNRYRSENFHMSFSIQKVLICRATLAYSCHKTDRSKSEKKNFINL